MEPSSPNHDHDPLDLELLAADLSSRLHDLSAENRHLRRLIAKNRRRRGWSRRVRYVQKRLHAMRRRGQLRRLASKTSESDGTSRGLNPPRQFEILVLHEAETGNLQRTVAALDEMGEWCRQVQVWIDPRLADGSVAWMKAHETDEVSLWSGDPIPDWNDVLDKASGSVLVVLSSQVVLSRRGIHSLVASLEGPPKAAAASACLRRGGDVLIPSLGWHRGSTRLRWTPPPNDFELPVTLGGWAFCVERASSRISLSLDAGSEAIASAITRNIHRSGRCLALAETSHAQLFGPWSLDIEFEPDPESRKLILEELGQKSPSVPFHLAVCRSIRESMPAPDPSRITRIHGLGDGEDADVVLIAQASDLERVPTARWLTSTRALFGDVGPRPELRALARACDLVVCPDETLAQRWRDSLGEQPWGKAITVITSDGLEELSDAVSWSKWLSETVA